MPEPSPAPASITTSNPNALQRLTVSGVAATRASPGSRSRRTAIFIMTSDECEGRKGNDGNQRRRFPPYGCSQADHTGDKSRDFDQGTCQDCVFNADQSKPHDDGDDCGNPDFGQLHEVMIGPLVLSIIVAGCRSIFDLAVIGHRKSPNSPSKSMDG